jgi:hypothetical protein
MTCVILNPVESPDARAAAIRVIVERVGRWNVGSQDIGTRCKDAVIFDVTEDGRHIGFYAVEVCGNTGFVIAAAAQVNTGQLSMTRRVLPLIERQFVGVQFVALATKRRALQREVERMGYAFLELLESGGRVYRKTVKGHHALSAF